MSRARCLAREVLVPGQQQLPVDPHLVLGGAAPAVPLAGDPLAHLGDHLVGQGDQVPLVDRDPRAGQRGADPGGVRGGGVDHDHLDGVAERRRLLGEPVLHARPGAARRQAEHPPRAGGVGVDERVSHGSVRRQPASARTHRTDRARVSSIPSTRTGSGAGSHLAAAATSARCAVGQDTRWARATSSTARFPDAIATASALRSRWSAAPAPGSPRTAA